MTNREQEVYQLIKKNPMISQKEIGEKLGIKRSSVGVHISNLIAKGYIKGKGYFISEKEYVVVIGGSNIDIYGKSNQKLKMEDSNPGSMEFSTGGVGRNIASNLSNLGIETKLLSIVGDDLYGRQILETTAGNGVDISLVKKSKNFNSSTYLSILNQDGEMKVAISSMDIINELDINYINQNDKIIKNAKCLVVDGNLKQDVIDYIFNQYFEKDIFVDTVSTTKAKKFKKHLDKIYALKPNKIEAEQLLGIKIHDKNEYPSVVKQFLSLGIQEVYISLGIDGVVYGIQEAIYYKKGQATTKENVTGAGDAFLAGIIYSYMNNFEHHKKIEVANALAKLTLKSRETTVNKNMIDQLLRRDLDD